MTCLWYDSKGDLLVIGDSGGVARTVPGVTGIAAAARAASPSLRPDVAAAAAAAAAPATPPTAAARAVRGGTAPLTLLGDHSAPPPAPAPRIDARAVRALWRGAAPSALRLDAIRCVDFFMYRYYILCELR